MKRILSSLVLCLLCTAFAGATPNASLTPIRANRHGAKHHHAHKAGKHSHPRHNHNTV